jgi:hypothetical protein
VPVVHDMGDPSRLSSNLRLPLGFVSNLKLDQSRSFLLRVKTISVILRVLNMMVVLPNCMSVPAGTKSLSNTPQNRENRVAPFPIFLAVKVPISCCMAPEPVLYLSYWGIGLKHPQSKIEETACVLKFHSLKMDEIAERR